MRWTPVVLFFIGVTAAFSIAVGAVYATLHAISRAVRWGTPHD